MPLETARIRHTSNFVTISNTAAQRTDLSFRARGVLTYLLSLPDGWETSVVAVAKAGTEGRDAVRTAIAELEAAGYLVRRREQNDRGWWDTSWDLYHEPAADRPATDFQSPETRPSDSQSPREKTETKTTPPCSSVATQPQNPSGVAQVRAHEDPPGSALVAVPDPSPPATVTARDRAHRLPDDFAVTAAMVAWCDQEGIPRDLARRETEKFRDHFRAAGGATARKRDWTAAWRNWLRRAAEEHQRQRSRYSGNARLDALSRGRTLAEEAQAAGVPITPFNVGKAAR